jgi:uncharacterized protein (TIGR02284 family)
MKEIVKQLNLLLAKTKEAEKGFAAAAEKADRSDLKNYFQEKSNRRNVFALEISTAIRELGETENPNHNYLGDIHRLWIDVKTAISFDKDEALLEECERGEKVSLEDYDKVLALDNLPSSVRNVLESQRSKVAATIGTMKLLE